MIEKAEKNKKDKGGGLKTTHQANGGGSFCTPLVFTHNSATSCMVQKEKKKKNTLRRSAPTHDGSFRPEEPVA